jgi:hypothetical protein
VTGAVAAAEATSARRRVPPAAVVGACVVLATASLPVPAAVAFDPWGWLVWGREVASSSLDTLGGPSWKPLPVLVTTLLAPFGDAAPDLWVVVARTAGLLLVVGTFALAARFAGPAAGVVAAGLLVLTPDGDPRFLRLVAEAHEAPMSAALAVWAVLRHLDGRRGQALLLAAGLALLRPEAWPFLAAYGAWLAWREPARRGAVAAALVVVPLLWFGGDWWVSGDPLNGAGSAQVATAGPLGRLAEALATTAGIVVLPAWMAAAAAVVGARRRSEAVPVALAAGAAAWCAVVVAMAAVLGYAALSRFLLPAAALVCALAGVGAVRLVRAADGRRPAAAALAGAAVVLALPRLAGLADVGAEVRDRGRVEDEIPAAIAAAGGREAVLACGAVAVDGASLVRPGVAWALDVPLRRVGLPPAAGPAVVFALAGGREDTRLLAAGDARPIGRTASWQVHAVGCPALDR